MTKEHSRYSIGDEVRVKEGALRGLEGIVSSLTEDKSARIIMAVNLLGQPCSVEIDGSLLDLVKSAQEHIKEELRIAVRPIATKLIYDLAAHPDRMHELSSRQFEELVAELLRDMGYDVILTPMTRDGGRDILAYFRLPHGNILTIVDCKQFSKNRRIGPDIVQRLLWISSQEDHASNAMIATTSYFTSGAKALGKRYKYQLSLKDFDGVANWLSRYGTWHKDGNSNIWLPHQTRGTNDSDIQPEPSR